MLYGQVLTEQIKKIAAKQREAIRIIDDTNKNTFEKSNIRKYSIFIK